MKNIFLVLVFTTLHHAGMCKCASWSLNAWPSGNTVHSNGVFMLEGYYNAEEIIEQLNIKYPIYLVSGPEKVKLNVEETLKGQFYLTQAILTPERPLAVDKDYTLYIDNLSEAEQPKKHNRFSGTIVPYTWKVIKGHDLRAPMWDGRPLEKDKSIEYYGCGPAVFVKFNCVVNETSNYLVRTSVTDTRTLKTVTYYLEPYGGSLNVGHDMCSGAFKFDSDAYEVSFDLMDASGNMTYWPGNRIKFSPPVNDEQVKKKK